jgi:hypothetical protein
MKTHLALITDSAITALAVGVQPAAQAAPEQGARSCFYINQINAYRADGDSTVYASAGPARIYRISMAAPCRNLTETSRQLLLEPPGSGLVCNAAGLTMTAISSGGTPERCFVQSIERLSPDEIASLPARLRR